MTIGRAILIGVCAYLSIGAASCNQPSPNGLPQTPIAKLAIYGRQVLDTIEQVQIQLIQMDSAGILDKADTAAAMTVFLKVGQTGQQLADLLELADNAKLADVRTSALARARGTLEVLDRLLTDVIVAVPSKDGRQTIAERLRLVARMLINLMSIITPQLPGSPLPEGQYL